MALFYGEVTVARTIVFILCCRGTGDFRQAVFVVKGQGATVSGLKLAFIIKGKGVAACGHQAVFLGITGKRRIDDAEIDGQGDLLVNIGVVAVQGVMIGGDGAAPHQREVFEFLLLPSGSEL